MNFLDFDTNFDYVFITEGVVDPEEFFFFPDCADYEGVEPIDYSYYYDYYDYYYDDYRVSNDNKDKPKRPLGSWFHEIDEQFGINKEKTVKRKHRSNSQNKRNKKRKNEKRQNNKNNNKKKNSNSNKSSNKRQFFFEYPYPIITVSANGVPMPN